jgi:hypothetical protein
MDRERRPPSVVSIFVALLPRRRRLCRPLMECSKLGGDVELRLTALDAEVAEEITQEIHLRGPLADDWEEAPLRAVHERGQREHVGIERRDEVGACQRK